MPLRFLLFSLFCAIFQHPLLYAQSTKAVTLTLEAGYSALGGPIRGGSSVLAFAEKHAAVGGLSVHYPLASHTSLAARASITLIPYAVERGAADFLHQDPLAESVTLTAGNYQLLSLRPTFTRLFPLFDGITLATSAQLGLALLQTPAIHAAVQTQPVTTYQYSTGYASGLDYGAEASIRMQLSTSLKAFIGVEWLQTQLHGSLKQAGLDLEKINVSLHRINMQFGLQLPLVKPSLHR